jgi:alkaline phosphatase D
VSVDLDGHLEPNSEYYYRFVYRDNRSRTGRCRTIPDSDASPARVWFGVVACQDYQNGYYGAYHHLVDEEIDVLVHLGDFIYNSAAGQFRGLGSDSFPDREISLPSGHDLAWTLADFRELYRTYLSTPALGRALERHTLVQT